jgi:hypothetical protein
MMVELDTASGARWLLLTSGTACGFVQGLVIPSAVSLLLAAQKKLAHDADIIIRPLMSDWTGKIPLLILEGPAESQSSNLAFTFAAVGFFIGNAADKVGLTSAAGGTAQCHGRNACRDLRSG